MFAEAIYYVWNCLFGFLSESLILCEQKSEKVICSWSLFLIKERQELIAPIAV